MNELEAEIRQVIHNLDFFAIFYDRLLKEGYPKEKIGKQIDRLLDRYIELVKRNKQQTASFVGAKKNRVMDINKLLEEWQHIDSDVEKEAFIERSKAAFDALDKAGKDKFADSFFRTAETEITHAEDLLELVNIRERINEVLPFINISAITKQYFKKSANWFYQRLNGNIVNGKPAKFSDSELGILRMALNDLSHKIRETSSKI
jgi:hypothetical protein